jgi:hypothetical protein
MFPLAAIILVTNKGQHAHLIPVVIERHAWGVKVAFATFVARLLVPLACRAYVHLNTPINRMNSTNV